MDKLPNSYLRWLITQRFPRDILDAADRKLRDSDFNNLHINVTRHALDMYSKRFLGRWFESQRITDPWHIDYKMSLGFSSYVAQEAQRAWETGEDISKTRHQDEGILRHLEGITWVFKFNPDFPDYKEVITVMP